jgi:hypothetical protein
MEKSLETVVALGVDVRKDPVEIGHGCLPLIAATPMAHRPFLTARRIGTR